MLWLLPNGNDNCSEWGNKRELIPRDSRWSHDHLPLVILRPDSSTRTERTQEGIADNRSKKKKEGHISSWQPDSGPFPSPACLLWYLTRPELPFRYEWARKALGLLVATLGWVTSDPWIIHLFFYKRFCLLVVRFRWPNPEHESRASKQEGVFLVLLFFKPAGPRFLLYVGWKCFGPDTEPFQDSSWFLRNPSR